MAFCPKCRSEFRSGFTVCSDCDARLVDNLPELKEDIFEPVDEKIDGSSLDFIAIFVSSVPEEASAIEGILTENKIPFIKRGNDARRFQYLEFLVREDKFLEAKDLLKDIIAKETEGIPVDYPQEAPEEKIREAPPVVFQGKGAAESAPGRADNLSSQLLLLILAIAALVRAVLVKSDKFVLAGIAAVVLLGFITLFPKEKRM
ncbi:MAG: hypothetical protein PHN57_04050 [Candidatus Omnitrophica bacterium]|nr:hypothetical protein [Candidatus Omnitrophota bacterium]